MLGYCHRCQIFLNAGILSPLSDIFKCWDIVTAVCSDRRSAWWSICSCMSWFKFLHYVTWCNQGIFSWYIWQCWGQCKPILQWFIQSILPSSKNGSPCQKNSMEGYYFYWWLMHWYPIPYGIQIYGDEVAASLVAIGFLFHLSSRHRSPKEKFLVTFEVKVILEFFM